MSQNRSARRHVQRSAEEKAAMVTEWQASGLSAQAFERQRGLSKCSLWRWQREVQNALRKAASPERSVISFAPVHISKVQRSTVLSQERMLAEVVVGHGIRVRVVEGADVDQVCLLVRALSGGVSC
jgi:hypothetical protein